jgi:arsenate reductase-like glutaredoxin family protein
MTKRLIAVAATTFLLLGLVSVPAQGASKNKAGGSCKKTNQRAKIAGFDYICQKNPTVKKAKLTWLIKECMDSHNQYIAGKKAYAKKLQEKADLLAQFAAAEADTSLTQADKDELAKSKAALLDTFDKLSRTSKDMYEMALTVRDLACTAGI